MSILLLKQTKAYSADIKQFKMLGMEFEILMATPICLALSSNAGENIRKTEETNIEVNHF